MRPARILVVEDERTSALLVRRDLERLGYQALAVATSGVEAVRLARETRPDLILMDIGLEGDWDGIETARRICVERTVPVVYLTAAGDRETIERAKGEGTFGYLIKPFSLAGLHSTIEMALHRRRLERDLAEREGQLAAILASIDEGIFALDSSDRIIFVNRAAERMSGIAERDARGRVLADVAPLEPLAPPHEGLFRLTPEEVPSRSVERRLAPIRGREETSSGTIVVLRDVGTQLAAEEEIRRQATHDALTGLPNRALFLDRLFQALSLAKRESRKVAVLFMDLDNFKNVNDTLGHDAGDTLLIEAARRLAGPIRESDTAARMGGDEFTFILQNVVDGNAAVRTAERLLKVLETPFPLRGRAALMTGSIGIALYPDQGEDPVTLMRQADTAMYRAKAAGKSCVRLYDPRADAARRLAEAE
jgi:diguanylate cyclase (GGDEF)-like protein/PAS domain S-box-containing protein